MVDKRPLTSKKAEVMTDYHELITKACYTVTMCDDLEIKNWLTNSNESGSGEVKPHGDREWTTNHSPPCRRGAARVHCSQGRAAPR